jgi:predicted transcriptional regulator of viral defense system
MGEYIPCMRTEQQVKTEDFFGRHPVFSLEEAARALQPPGGRAGTVERLKYHLETGRLKRVAREVYAVVPRGSSVDTLQPDVFLVALSVRPEAVFSCHSALELLGVAHSVWNRCTVFCTPRRSPLTVNRNRVLFLEHPTPLRKSGDVLFGTRKVERLGRLMRVTGPERTLVECFRRLDLAGGIAELAESAGGFPTLDLELVESTLKRYGMSSLWAATGWFLETYRRTFHVPDALLTRLESHRPLAPQYLVRQRRGGTLAARWNLILPPEMEHLRGPDER